MDQELEYRGQMTMAAAVLPARAAYLISVGSVPGFKRAVRTASERWGGVAEPIIQVAEDGGIGPEDRALIERAAVVGVVNVDVDEEAAKKVAAALALPHETLGLAGPTGITGYTSNPKHIAEMSMGTFCFAATEANLWEIAAAGHLRDEAETLGIASPPLVKRTEDPEEIMRAQCQERTLLDLTEVQLGEYYRSGGLPVPGPTVLWVSAPNSLEECLAFWNFRALRPRGIEQSPILLVPDTIVEWETPPFREFQQMLTRPIASSPDVVVCSRNVASDRLHEIATMLDLHATDNWHLAGRFPTPPLRQPPYTYQVNAELNQLVMFERSYGQANRIDVHVFPKKTRLEFPSPVQFWGPARGLVHIWGEPFEGLPERPAVAAMVHQGATWSRGKLQLAMWMSQVYTLDLEFPSLKQVSERLLSEHTAKFEPSDKGSIGLALQAQGKLAMLREPGIFDALKALTTPRSKSLVKELNTLLGEGIIDERLHELAQSWGSRTERKYLPASGLTGSLREGRVEMLEKLCAIGWAERGMQVDCPQCKIAGFVPLSDLEQAVRCPGCTASAVLTAEKTGVVTFYRLNSLIDRAIDQGVIPHLMAIAVLESEAETASFVPGLNLWFEGEANNLEVDIFGIADGQVIAGEVKTSAAEFTEVQIEKDLKVSTLLGAEIYVLAAIDEVPDATRSLAQAKCADVGIELKILDQADFSAP